MPNNGETANKDTTIAGLADLHGGSTVGLMYPRSYQFRGRNARQSDEQKALWRRFVQLTEHVRVQRQGRRLFIKLNGDLIDGDHHGTLQLHTRVQSEQMQITLDCLYYFLDEVGYSESDGDRIYVINGTEPTHGSPAITDQIAYELGAVPWRKGKPLREYSDDEKENQRRRRDAGEWRPFQRLRLEVNGKLFDFAHHPPAGKGGRVWTEGNQARSWLKSELITNRLNDARSSDFYIYAHKHSQMREYVEVGNQRAWIYLMPALQLKTEYVYRLAIYQPTSIGGFVAQVDADGTVSSHDNVYTNLWQPQERIVTA